MYIVVNTFGYHVLNNDLGDVGGTMLIKTENQMSEGFNFLLVCLFRLCQLEPRYIMIGPIDVVKKIV